VTNAKCWVGKIKLKQTDEIMIPQMHDEESAFRAIWAQARAYSVFPGDIC
jgi:hypothetical protein